MKGTEADADISAQDKRHQQETVARLEFPAILARRGCNRESHERVDERGRHEIDDRAILHRHRPDDGQQVQQAKEGHHQPKDVRDG